jgi:aspartyl-tRNA(Asn)/glutamyl-tRNA(Gln) amidotransferase subunit A
MSPYELTLREAVERLDAGDLTSRELVESCLARVERVDPAVGAFLSLDAEDALRRADEVDGMIRQGVDRKVMPLAGVPVGFKDVIAVRGQPLTCASRMLEKFQAPYDASVTQKVVASGGIPFGRLNMDEFAMGSSCENSAVRKTRNPWDLERSPGGSSGGSAAAVAAQECPVSLGSDTGGSVRQPAAFCGVVGLKPTYGRVSRYGLVAFASSLDQIGPVTRSVGDAATMLSVISGRDERDCTSVPEPVPDFAGELGKGVAGLKVGLPREYFEVQGLDPQVRAAVEAAVRVLEGLGVEVREITLPHTEYAVATYYILATAEASANLARFDGVRYGYRVEGDDPVALYSRTRGAGFGAEVKRRIILGTYVLSSGYYDAYYLRAQKVRTLIRQDFERAFEQVDAVVTPTAPRPAFRLGENEDDPLQMYLEDIYTLSCNLAGNCGLSVPCGFAGEGAGRLPIGLQMLGRPFGESTLLRLGHAYEQAAGWFRERAEVRVP